MSIRVEILNTKWRSWSLTKIFKNQQKLFLESNNDK